MEETSSRKPHELKVSAEDTQAYCVLKEGFRILVFSRLQGWLLARKAVGL